MCISYIACHIFSSIYRSLIRVKICIDNFKEISIHIYIYSIFWPQLRRLTVMYCILTSILVSQYQPQKYWWSYRIWNVVTLLMMLLPITASHASTQGHGLLQHILAVSGEGRVTSWTCHQFLQGRIKRQATICTRTHSGSQVWDQT